MFPFAVGLGSNLGDRLGYLQRATDLLGEVATVTAASPVFETAPQIVVDQPPFLNAVLLGQTDLGPYGLLGVLKEIEERLGRQRRIRYGPREIDLDLLAFGALHLDGEALVVPHGRIRERRFVLEPLCRVAPDLALPGLGRVSQLLDATKDPASSVMESKDAVLQVHSNR